jgi:hypothetical protein
MSGRTGQKDCFSSDDDDDDDDDVVRVLLK